MLNIKLKFSLPSNNGQTEVVNRRLGDLLHCFVGENITMWGLILPMAEFAYGSSVNRSNRYSPSEVMIRIQPDHPIDLVVLPPNARDNIKPEGFSRHKNKLHDEVHCEIVLSNDIYRQGLIYITILPSSKKVIR